MNHKRIYYSCCTSLAYFICERYYAKHHYVWCTPYFDPFSRMSQNNCPEAVELAKIILGKIEEMEGKEIEALDTKTADRYICELGIANDDLIERVEGLSRERGDELRRRLFESEP